MVVPRFPVRRNGLWGYIDREGREVIKPAFSRAEPFADGLGRVRSEVGAGFLWGYVDTDGRVQIGPRFRHAGNFSEARAVVYDQDFKPSIIDKTGDVVFAPEAAEVRGFSEGVAAMKVGSMLGAGKWGFLDREGKIFVEPRFEQAGNFAKGLACVKVGDRFGYIDRSGERVIEAQYENARSFSDGLAAVKIGGLWGYIDSGGKTIIDPQFGEAGTFSEKLACVTYSPGKAGLVRMKNVGWVDTRGELAIAWKFDWGGPFCDERARFSRSDLHDLRVTTAWGYIDRVGEPAFDLKVEWGASGPDNHLNKFYDFSDGMARVDVDGKTGYLDKAGAWVWPLCLFLVKLNTTG
jgi:hypothetical protein